MWQARVFNVSLFLVSVVLAFSSDRILIHKDMYIKALLIYWIFSSLNQQLRVRNKSGKISIDYGISYSLSFGVFTGPLGVLIFETIYRFTVYFNKKRTKTTDPDEFFDTFYNIGAFAFNNSIAYFLFQHFYPSFQSIPFGFWILMFLLVCVTSVLSDTFLIILFSILGEIKTRQDAIDFILSRSLLDMGKIAITNGLLILFLQEGNWEVILILFILNYLVSRSFLSKSQNIQNKIERDKFEQMAYTDFLTGVSNRAYMDKKMAELNNSGEYIGIVVADIDKFKRINDNYNHAVGDRVIQHIASTIKGYINEDDILFRSGGEEFTIFLRKRSFDVCVILVEEILRCIEDNSVNVEYKSENIAITYTASFGLYYYKINEQSSIEKAYINADQLMLQSKNLGRNRVSVKNEMINN